MLLDRCLFKSSGVFASKAQSLHLVADLESVSAIATDASMPFSMVIATAAVSVVTPPEACVLTSKPNST